MRKPDFCLGNNKGAYQLHRENKGTDQLRSNCEADQRLCFHYTDNVIPLLPKSEISSCSSSSVTQQSGLCQVWSETRKTVFLALWLICIY